MGLLQAAAKFPASIGFHGLERIARKPRALSSPVGAIAGWHDELEFAALRLAYRRWGGLARGDEIGRLLANRVPESFGGIAKLLEDGEVFGFEWDALVWIPVFQLGLDDLAVKPRPRQVRAELGDDFDGWAVSAWFVEPNIWLARARPIELLESDLEVVLQAARADRFVAAG